MRYNSMSLNFNMGDNDELEIECSVNQDYDVEDLYIGFKFLGEVIDLSDLITSRQREKIEARALEEASNRSADMAEAAAEAQADSRSDR